MFSRFGSGPLIMLVGYLLFGSVPVLIRLAKNYDWCVSHTLLFRFGFALVAVLLIHSLASKGSKDWSLNPVNRKLLFFRGLFGGAAVICYFASIQYLGAGKGTLLNYTHSLFANFFGFLFLKQKPAKQFWLYLLLAFAGLWLLINPTFDGFSWQEAAGLFSGMLGGGAILCIKKLRDSDNALTIFSSLTFFGLLFSIPAIFLETSAQQQIFTITPARLVPLGWLLLFLMASLSMLGQLCFTQGYKNTSVALGTVMSLIVPVLAVLSGWLILDEEMSWNIIAGGFLILSASALTGLLERKIKKAKAANV